MMQQPPSYQTDNFPDDPTLPGQPVETIPEPEIVQSAQDAPVAPTPQAARSARGARRLPIARVIGLGFILIVVVVLVGIAALQINSAQRQTAYNIDPYPNATLRDQRKIGNTADEMIYVTTDSIEKVGTHYSNKMGKAGLFNDEGCRRIFSKFLPTNVPTSEPIGVSETPDDSFYNCAVDNSFLGSVQITTVSITYDMAAQRTIIVVRRDWGSS